MVPVNLVKGGRYNSLLNIFCVRRLGIGFALVMEQVMNALERQNIEIPVSSQKTMVVYPEHLRSAAVKMVRKDRMGNEDGMYGAGYGQDAG